MKTTWDDSITKRAMNPAVPEHGYIPAATENSLADVQINAAIQRDTHEAEIAAGKHGNAGNTSPQILDGLGTMVRNAVEKVKGTKDGDLEPKHHKITRNSHLHRHHHQHDDDEDSVDMEERKGRESMLSSMWGGDKDKQSLKDDAESIIEPTPGDARSEQREEEGPGAGEEIEQVPVDRPIVDNEVEDFVTEQLYIHSKLMIVDDRIVICGSGTIFFFVS